MLTFDQNSLSLVTKRRKGFHSEIRKYKMSESSNTITKVLIGAGIAVATAAVIAYLFNKEEKALPAKGSLTADNVTKAQLLQILNEIHIAHEKMRGVTKQLSSEILAKKLDFQQTYQKVIEVQPVDPLDKYGLSMVDFDRLLEREQYDPQVRQSLNKLMAAPESTTLEPTKELTVSQMLDIHRFILAELHNIVKTVEALNAGFDSKTVMIAAQAMVGAHVEGRFGATGDDVESATSKLSVPLSGNAEFNNLNLQIQQAMTELMAVCENRK